MRKRITSALLTLVMLLSLIPAMGTTAAAADTTNKSLYIAGEYPLDNGKYITQDAPNAPVAFDGNANNLPSGKTYAALYNNTLYLKGDWGGAVGIMGPHYDKKILTNPLNIVVMGDTTIRNLDLRWENTAKEDSKATIELSDNATLTVNHTGSRDSSSAINAMYWYTADGNNRWLGSDITVKGTGTLKVNANISSRQVSPFVKASTFSITENVNLDAKVVASGDIANDKYYGFSLDKFVINTTGYVKIDTSGYANALMLPTVMQRYELKNASSITLTASAKDKMFDSGDVKTVDYFITDCCTGWKVAKSDDTAKPYSLKIIPASEDFHPIKVGRLKDGNEMRVSYKSGDYTYDAYLSDTSITGNTPDQKWEKLKEISKWTSSKHGECNVVGWSYYDPDSGRFYHKGSVYVCKN